MKKTKCSTTGRAMNAETGEMSQVTPHLKLDGCQALDKCHMPSWDLDFRV